MTRAKLLTIRGMFKMKKQTPVPLEEVEPVEAIMKRFVTGAGVLRIYFKRSTRGFGNGFE